MPAISDNVGMGIEMSYDLMKIFHQNKPVNSSTGVKNPTVVNGSWGYQSTARNNQYHYTRFRGSDRFLLMNRSYSTYPADARTMVRGFNNQVSGAYRSWSSSKLDPTLLMRQEKNSWMQVSSMLLPLVTMISMWV